MPDTRSIDNGTKSHEEPECDSRQAMLYAKDLVRLYQLERERAKDLRSGALMQKRFLTPARNVQSEFRQRGYRVATINRAPFSVSGDFFCPKPIDGDSAGLFLADTSGHGLSAALLSMRLVSFIQTTPSSHCPSAFLELIHNDIQGLMLSGNFVVGSYAVFSHDRCIFSNAGQPFPCLIRNGKLTEIPVAGPPLGLAAGITAYNDFDTTVHPADRILLHTDGLTEAGNSHGELFGHDRLLESIERHSKEPLETMLDNLMADFDRFRGPRPLEDDVSVIAFERMGGVR